MATLVIECDYDNTKSFVNHTEVCLSKDTTTGMVTCAYTCITCGNVHVRLPSNKVVTLLMASGCELAELPPRSISNREPVGESDIVQFGIGIRDEERFKEAIKEIFGGDPS